MFYSPFALSPRTLQLHPLQGEHLAGTRLRGSSPLPWRHPAEGLAHHRSWSGDCVLQNQDIPPERKMLYEMLDLLTCSWVAGGQEHPRLPLVRGRRVLAQCCTSVRVWLYFRNWPLKHLQVVAGDTGWGYLDCASEAVWNKVPAPFCGWYCQSILDQGITQSIQKIAML